MEIMGWCKISLTLTSGYLDNALMFDGIDDFITIPESLIDLDNFTYSEGINVLSFRGDNVATVVDGVVEIGGGIIVNSDFKEGAFRWSTWYGGVFNGATVILTKWHIDIPKYKYRDKYRSK